jgi:ankyrin repeat protein
MALQAAVRMLLDAGAAVDAQAANGDTPLHDAAENGHRAVVQVLLGHGASTTLVNGDGKTAADVVRPDDGACCVSP